MNAKHIIFITLTVAVVAFLFSNHRNWNLVIGPLHSENGTGYPFADMQARLGMAQGLSEGIDVNREQNPHTRSNVLNNKPLYTIQILSSLSLGSKHATPLGILFGITFLMWCFWLLRPERWIDFLLCVGVVLSPPVLLLLERANDDIIIFSFILFTPLLLNAKMGLLNLSGWLIITLLTPMKFYPAAAYSLLFFRHKSLTALLCWASASIAFLIGLYFVMVAEMETLRDRIPDPPASFAVGGKLIFQTLGVEPGLHSLLTFGMFAMVLLAAVLAMLLTAEGEDRRNPLKARFFLLGSSILTFCFLLNSNWDYRMAFVVPTIPYALWQLRSGSGVERTCTVVYICGVLLTSWPEYIFFLHGYAPDSRSWTFDRIDYRSVLLLKHTASWLMISMMVVLSALILRHDAFRLMKTIPGGTFLLTKIGKGSLKE